MENVGIARRVPVWEALMLFSNCMSTLKLELERFFNRIKSTTLIDPEVGACWEHVQNQFEAAVVSFNEHYAAVVMEIDDLAALGEAPVLLYRLRSISNCFHSLDMARKTRNLIEWMKEMPDEAPSVLDSSAMVRIVSDLEEIENTVEDFLFHILHKR